MKIFLSILTGLAFAGILSFTQRPTIYDARQNTAEVEQIQGLYVFVDSKPVLEYDYLGTINGTGGRASLNPQYTVVRDILLKRAKKDYPTADGIILHLNAGGRDRCDVIKFKEVKKE